MAQPSIQDLKDKILFEEEKGCIWLGEHRMLLLHTSTFGALRSELISSLGFERAKGMLMRMGYASGMSDARLARKIRPDVTEEEAFAVGPQLHGLEGVVKVEPVKLEIDMAGGHYYGEFNWYHSVEADEHVKALGLHDGPVCWNQIGYASGYTSEFMRRPIFYKEVECVGKGDRHCRIIGRPLDQWEDGKELALYYSQESIAETLYSLSDEVANLRSSLSEAVQPEQIIGRSPLIKQALQLLRTAANSDVTVLMLGETGVGKEVFSNALHQMSPRHDRPFVAVNCAALPKDLIEAELFGVEQGAYTGAEKPRPGRFERAHGGVLFLDEVGELTERAQAKLLRVLQTGEVDRVGSVATRKVDVRLVAATNSDLEKMIKDGRFRADLYYRLNVFPVHIPPLRERLEDLQGLVKKFIGRYNTKYGKQVPGLTDRAMEWFRSYGWPGNIRELENVLERGVLLAPSGCLIDTSHLFAQLEPSETSAGSRIAAEGGLVPASECTRRTFQDLVKQDFSLDDLESELMKMALQESKGNVSAAARLLKLGDAQFRYRMKKYNISKHLI